MEWRCIVRTENYSAAVIAILVRIVGCCQNHGQISLLDTRRNHVTPVRMDLTGQIDTPGPRARRAERAALLLLRLDGEVASRQAKRAHKHRDLVPRVHASTWRGSLGHRHLEALRPQVAMMKGQL